MRNIPAILIYSRIVLGLAIMLLALWQPTFYRATIIAMIAVGLVSDILDGIVARRLGISTEKMRRLDSGVDQVFWTLVIAGTCIVSPAFYKDHYLALAIIVAAEVATYVLSYIKFQKEVATHAILSKVWTLTIFTTLVDAIATGSATWSFYLCFYAGLISRLEIIGILLLLRQWTNDVPSLYHAVQMRKGRTIKRSKWFNG
ncbi:MAG: CDP-alcohol phosphatidyltransferase family protein [Bacteroidota bacterium]